MPRPKSTRTKRRTATPKKRKTAAGRQTTKGKANAGVTLTGAAARSIRATGERMIREGQKLIARFPANS